MRWWWCGGIVDDEDEGGDDDNQNLRVILEGKPARSPMPAKESIFQVYYCFTWRVVGNVGYLCFAHQYLMNILSLLSNIQIFAFYVTVVTYDVICAD